MNAIQECLWGTLKKQRAFPRAFRFTYSVHSAHIVPNPPVYVFYRCGLGSKRAQVAHTVEQLCAS